jgi:hypothetical protein
MPYSKLEMARCGSNECLKLAEFIRWHRLHFKMDCQQAAELAGLTLHQWLALEEGWIPLYGASLWHSLASTLEINFEELTLLADASRRACELHRPAA